MRNKKISSIIKLIAISLLVVMLGFVYSRSLGDDMVGDSQLGECPVPMVQNVYSSSDVRVTEIFLCEGLDEAGQPRNLLEVGKSNEWETINLCVFVTTTEPSSLSAYWIYEDKLEFTGWGVYEHAYNEEYVAFSLAEAVACTMNASDLAFPNYLADEMEAGYIPAGQYHVEIHQGRRIVDEFSFFVEN
jgi:hypothetical protein